MVARTVGEAVVLAAEGERAAALAAQIEVFTAARRERFGMVSVTKRLARQSAATAGLTLVLGGAEARHEDLRAKEKRAKEKAAQRRPFFFFYPIYPEYQIWG